MIQERDAGTGKEKKKLYNEEERERTKKKGVLGH